VRGSTLFVVVLCFVKRELKGGMTKQYLYIFTVFLLFLSVAVIQNHKVSWALGEPNLKMWNAEKVDWWVSMDDQTQQGVRQGCEIHWLYDDVLDVSLNVSDKKQLYYSFEVLSKQDVSVPIVDYRQANSAFLVIDKEEIPLEVASGNFSQVVMTPMNDLNSVEYLKDARRLLLGIGDTIYNFPLENADENFLYFKKCLSALSIDVANDTDFVVPRHGPTKVNSVERQELPSEPTRQGDTYTDGDDDWALSYDVKALKLFSPVADVDKEPVQSVKEIGGPKVGIAKQAKQADSMLKDVHRSEIAKKSKVGTSGGNAYSGAEYSSHNTGIIRNLTRKLAILEREKEELRVKMLGTSGSKMLRDVVACNTPMEEDLNEPLSDEVIEQFEDTINKLRAENELLRDASLSVEEVDTSFLGGEIESMQKQINDLMRANEGLAEENDQLQLQIEEDAEDLFERDQEGVSKFEQIVSEVTEEGIVGDGAHIGGESDFEIDLEALEAEDSAIRDRLKDLTGSEVE